MAKYDFRTQRIFIDLPLSAGRELTPDRKQANYLLNVLRLKQGAPILLFNGKDGEWLARLEPQGRKNCSLKIQHQTRPQTHPYLLTYCFAPLKQARLDYMVQKAVEMGVGNFQPVLTHHTQVTKLNLDRIRANAIEAAEQCGILNIPAINTPVRLEALIDNWPAKKNLIFADESAKEANPATELRSLFGKEIALLIGPEGGFSDQERKQLIACEFVTQISLGPRILRADTAAVAALALLQANCGDWQTR